MKDAIEEHPFPLDFHDNETPTHYFSCEITAGAPQKLFRSLEEVVAGHGFKIIPRLTAMSDILPLPIQNSGSFDGNIVGEAETVFHSKKIGFFRMARWFVSNIISIRFSGEVYQSEHMSRASGVESRRFTMVSDTKLTLGVWEARTKNLIDKIGGRTIARKRILFGEVNPAQYSQKFEHLITDLKANLTPKVELLQTQRLITKCSYCGSSKDVGEKCRSCGADS